MIYALLSKIVASRIYVILWAKSLRMPGLGGGGGQPNLGNACILGLAGPITPPLSSKKNNDLAVSQPSRAEPSSSVPGTPLSLRRVNGDLGEEAARRLQVAFTLVSPKLRDEKL